MIKKKKEITHHKVVDWKYNNKEQKIKKLLTGYCSLFFRPNQRQKHIKYVYCDLRRGGKNNIKISSINHR